MNWVGIGSGNGLSRIWCQAITPINTDLLLIRPIETKFSKIRNTKLFSRENAFGNVVCEMAPLLSRGEMS